MELVGGRYNPGASGQVFPMGAGVYGTLATLIDGGFKMIFLGIYDNLTQKNE